jgi:hypothetical protein
MVLSPEKHQKLIEVSESSEMLCNCFHRNDEGDAVVIISNERI